MALVNVANMVSAKGIFKTKHDEFLAAPVYFILFTIIGTVWNNMTIPIHLALTSSYLSLFVVRLS